MEMEEINLLKAEAFRVFPKTMPPAAGNIAPHPCAECEGVRDAFNGVKWWETSFELIAENYDKLPLLTPFAYHYYFPAYLIGALNDPGSSIYEFLIYSWSIGKEGKYFKNYEERVALFSPEQIEVVTAFLRAVLSDPEMYIYYKNAEKALALIGKHYKSEIGSWQI